MSYKIEYVGRDFEHFKLHNNKKRILRSLFVLSAVVIATVVLIITPVRTTLLDYILPGNGPVTRQAAGDMIQSLKGGESFREAFTDFCIEIFENA